MGKGYFKKEVTFRAECPFCGLPIDRPVELATRRMGEMPVGTCLCGAVYACDVSGRNLGSAFIEALVFGCNMDWDLAWNLFPEEDYLEKLVENYDFDTHRFVPGGFYEGRRVRGALYFIRLHKDIQEVTQEGVQGKLKRAKPDAAAPANPSPPAKRFTRQEVGELVEQYRPGPLLSNTAGQEKRILRDLQRLLYSGDELLRTRAADVLGKVSAVIARKDPGIVSDLLQRLFNAVTDTAASSWGAIDAIGEIIGNSPDIFSGYIPLLYQFLEEEPYQSLRPRIVRALGRAAETRPDILKKSIFRIIPLLGDTVPETRGYAALLCGNLGAPEAGEELERLEHDQNQLSIYLNGNIEKMTVGQLAAEALAKIYG